MELSGGRRGPTLRGGRQLHSRGARLGPRGRQRRPCSPIRSRSDAGSRALRFTGPIGTGGDAEPDGRTPNASRASDGGSDGGRAAGRRGARRAERSETRPEAHAGSLREARKPQHGDLLDEKPLADEDTPRTRDVRSLVGRRCRESGEPARPTSRDPSLADAAVVVSPSSQERGHDQDEAHRDEPGPSQRTSGSGRGPGSGWEGSGHGRVASEGQLRRAVAGRATGPRSSDYTDSWAR